MPASAVHRPVMPGARPLAGALLLAVLASGVTGCAPRPPCPPHAPRADGAAPAAASAQELPPALTPAPNPLRAERIAELAERARLAAQQDPPPTLVFLGDSHMEGWEHVGRPTWEERYAPLGALQLGIGGDQTQNVLWRLREGHLDGLQPRVLVLLIGNNNTASGMQPAEQIRDGVAAILDELCARMPRTSLLLLGPLPCHWRPDDPARVNNVAASRLIEALCDGVRVRWFDVGRNFTAPDGRLRPDLMPDALHLNAKGYALWGELMEPVLAERLAAPPPY